MIEIYAGEKGLDDVFVDGRLGVGDAAAAITVGHQAFSVRQVFDDLGVGLFHGSAGRHVGRQLRLGDHTHAVFAVGAVEMAVEAEQVEVRQGTKREGFSLEVVQVGRGHAGRGQRLGVVVDGVDHIVASRNHEVGIAPEAGSGVRTVGHVVRNRHTAGLEVRVERNHGVAGTHLGVEHEEGAVPGAVCQRRVGTGDRFVQAVVVGQGQLGTLRHHGILGQELVDVAGNGQAQDCEKCNDILFHVLFLLKLESEFDTAGEGLGLRVDTPAHAFHAAFRIPPVHIVEGVRVESGDINLGALHVDLLEKTLGEVVG